MLSQNQIEKVNIILKDKVFKYKGPIILNVEVESDIDYTVELLGYKKMISVGEWVEYMKVSVSIISLNDQLSKLVFSWDLSKKDFPDYLKQMLSYDISQTLSIFDTTDNRVLIESISLNLPKEEIVTESRMSKIAIRTVVRDIIEKVKKGKSGFFYLPEDNEEYEFTNLPFSFSVELILKIDFNLDKFKVNGYYVPEEEVIELLVIFNPKKIREQLYELVGDLNELFAHELEHGYQEYRGEFQDDNEEPEESLLYYTQDKEIPAQYRGFKRLANLTKKPIKDVASEWFEKNKDIHGLTDDEIKIVMDKVLNYGR